MENTEQEIEITESLEGLNIYQKLLIIQQKINGLGKDKEGESNKYKYVTGDKLLGYVKPLMNNLRLILKQEITSIENVRQDYATRSGSKSEINSKVMFRFTWVDVDTKEKDENIFGANGQNGWDKGVGSALTYAERYFLLKFFHIATDEDDIDNPEAKQEPKLTPAEQYTLDYNNHKLNINKIEAVALLTKYYNTLPETWKSDKDIIELVKLQREKLTPKA